MLSFLHRPCITRRSLPASYCCLSKPKYTNDASEDRVFLDLPAVFHAQTMHRETDSVFCLVIHAVFHSQSTQTMHQKTESAWSSILPFIAKVHQWCVRRQSLLSSSCCLSKPKNTNGASEDRVCLLSFKAKEHQWCVKKQSAWSLLLSFMHKRCSS